MLRVPCACFFMCMCLVSDLAGYILIRCSFIAFAEEKLDAGPHIGRDRHTQCVNGRGQIGMFSTPTPCYVILVCSRCSHVTIWNNICLAPLCLTLHNG